MMSDVDFDQAICHMRGYEFFCECKFTKGDSGKRGRKPSPDGVLVDTTNRCAYYIESKRPSECISNSWLVSYKADRFPVIRKKCAELSKNDVMKDRARALTILEEHDEHMRVQGSRWNNPVDLKADTRALVFVLPEDERSLVKELTHILKKLGRFINVLSSRQVSFIFAQCESHLDNAEAYIASLCNRVD